MGGENREGRYSNAFRGCYKIDVSKRQSYLYKCAFWAHLSKVEGFAMDSFVIYVLYYTQN